MSGYARAAGLALTALFAACVPDPYAGRDVPVTEVDTGYVELGDVDRLREQGRIRFANVARAQIEELPRLRWGMPSEDRLAQEFADRMGLELEVLEYASEDEARDALLEGRVDGIVGRSGSRAAQPPEGVAYSIPFTLMPGVLVGRAGAVPDSLSELEGRTVTLVRGSALLGFADSLTAVQPGLTVDTVDDASVVDVIDRLRTGGMDLTLAERWVAEAVVAFDPALEIGLPFGEVLYTAAVRASNPDLLRLVNDFRFSLASGAGDAAGGTFRDLIEIKEQRVLRVLTVNGPSSYFVHRGELVGFDLELIRMFADEQDVIAQMVVAPSVEAMESWLARGLGDMIGAGVMPPVIGDTATVRLTRVYHDVHPVIVGRSALVLDADDPYLGRTFVVARNNPYLPLLPGAVDSLGASMEVTTDAESTHQLLDRLDRGEADLTVLESHLAAAELPDHPDLAVLDSVPDFPGRSWAVRADQPELLGALDAFLERQVGSATHAVLVRKYFQPETRVVSGPGPRDDGSLSPWDDAIRRHAADVGLDWRLLAAQMFQESRFDPRARSPVGAYGLMQMMPATARQMGVRDLEDPEEQIRAGVQYMGWLYRRFAGDIDLADRMAFTLAAYNAGWGHVRDARRVAELTGLDPNKWFDNVEVSMLSLADPDVYNFTLHGYVRGDEPVRYVRRITELGQMYYRAAPSG